MSNDDRAETMVVIVLVLICVAVWIAAANGLI